MQCLNISCTKAVAFAMRSNIRDIQGQGKCLALIMSFCQLFTEVLLMSTTHNERLLMFTINGKLLTQYCSPWKMK